MTHEVLNQPPPLEGYDVFGADRALTDGAERHGASWAVMERWSGWSAVLSGWCSIVATASAAR